MKNLRLIFMAFVCLLMLALSACASPTTAVPTEAPEPDVIPTEAPEPTEETTVDYANQLEDFNPANFDDPTSIDNPWLPLKPGMQYIYEGVAEEGGELKDHRVIITVIDIIIQNTIWLVFKYFLEI